jgi:predicted ATPase
LAHHYTEAGLNEQAVDYWYKAGQKATQRSAYVETVLTPTDFVVGEESVQTIG